MRPPRSHPTNTLEKSRKHGTYLHCKQTPKRQKTLYTICFRTTAKQHGGRQNGLLLPLTCVFPRVFVCFPVCSAAQPRTAVCSLEAAQQQQQQHKKRGRNNIYSFVSSSTPRRIVQTRGHRKPNEWRWPGPNCVLPRRHPAHPNKGVFRGFGGPGVPGAIRLVRFENSVSSVPPKHRVGDFSVVFQ